MKNMRRADRLFQIVQYLRGPRPKTAREIARRLEVSERTIYRDIRDLSLSGVPIEGEAGVGYLLRGFEVPPLMFTPAEIEALVVGARLVEAWAGQELGEATRRALEKIEAVLPDRLKGELGRPRLFAIFQLDAAHRTAMDQLRTGINLHRRVHFHYTRRDGEASQRAVRPLGLYYWGQTWTLAAWCESRQDFRSFRPDRMREVGLGEAFPEEPGKTLADYIRRMEEDDTLT